MERHANYALVGVLTTLIVLGGLVFVVWLGSFGIGESHDRYRIVFQGPVRGLSKGGEVQFNGIKSGEIKSISLAAGDTSKVVADIEVDRDTPIRTDSIASTESQGISGVNVVQVSAGSASRPLLKTSSRDDPPVIRSKPSAMSSLLQGGGQVIERANEALDRVNRLLADRTIANLAGAAADLRSVSSELATNRTMIRDAASAIAKLDRASSDVEASARTVRELTDGDGRRAVAKAAAAMDTLDATLKDARAAIGGISAQTGKFGTTTLPAINETMESLRETSEQLSRLIGQIRQDPRATLTRGSGRERKVKP